MTDITSGLLPSSFDTRNLIDIFTNVRKHPDTSVVPLRGLLNATYRSFVDDLTYSLKYFSNEFNHSNSVTEPWLTPELNDFLSQSSDISLPLIQYLLSEIQVTFGQVPIETVMHTDPDEGWTKPVFIIQSGIQNTELLMQLEETFFNKADNEPKLLSVLPYVVISLA